MGAALGNGSNRDEEIHQGVVMIRIMADLGLPLGCEGDLCFAVRNGVVFTNLMHLIVGIT